MSARITCRRCGFVGQHWDDFDDHRCPVQPDKPSPLSMPATRPAWMMRGLVITGRRRRWAAARTSFGFGAGFELRPS